ncbi:ABC transporter permease [Ktedonosporobacter rubrisoli]|uniref:ABC transporter permease n=1 Tax=Ktedonosporobacter rubrisoli TaxID=2509675 RepID=A0A4P6K2L7_KTERU|nr:ABC transporter permease [Ktedonosporobacter rubrisoli]QBD81726.1 ABC transporter permease [Ktedonosporobacter rubrisoli]
MMAIFWRSLLSICKKDTQVWLRHPSTVLVTFLPAIALLLLTALGSAAVGHSPVALVLQDQGAAGQKIDKIFHDADIFQIYDVDEQQAQALMHNVDIAAIIVIPGDFTQRVQAHQNAPIDVTVNNLNLDFTNDVRRSVPDIITQFYATQGPDSPIKVTLREHDLRTRDVELFQYTVLPAIIFLLSISGLVTGSLATAREWEAQTIKELLLSPVAHAAIIGGKVLSSVLITFIMGTLVLLACTLLGWVQPEGPFWLSALLTILLVSLLSSGLGIAVGTLVRRVQPVGPVSINVGMYLFFLAGGVGVLAFEPIILQQIADFIPLTYGRHALEMAVFYSSADQFGRDILMLTISSIIAVVLGILAMRKGVFQ